MHKQLLFISLLLFCQAIKGQDDRFIGLIDKTLVAVNPYEPSLESIVTLDFPNNSDGTDMAYSIETCLFYTILDAVDNPKLISFDFYGNVETVGQFTIPGGNVFTAEAIAYDIEGDNMYISGSLNGQDFFSETLMIVDLETAVCEVVTRLDFENGNDPDVDNMVIDQGTLYFNDGQPGPSLTDHYSVDIDDLNSGTTSLLHYYRLGYDGSSDVVYFQDSLFYPALDFSLFTHVPFDNNQINLGKTHSNADYNGARIRGFEYVEDLTVFNYSQAGIDTIICDGGVFDINLDATDLEVVWNNGETGTSISVTEEGIYYAIVFLNECYITTTDTFSLAYAQGEEESVELLICDGNDVTINNITYDQEGTFMQELTSSDGLCDSTLIINLLTAPLIFAEEYITLCEGETHSIGDSTYSSSGEYLTTIPSFANCDSIIFSEILINSDTESFLDFFECTGSDVEVNGTIYDSTGDYIQMTQNTFGCDSTLNISVTIANEVVLAEDYEICDGATLEIYDLTITEEGIYDVTLDVNGICDTIINIVVEVNEASEHIESYTLCPDETIEINGIEYNTAGTFEQNLLNVNNCDSLLIIDVLISENSIAEIEVVSCEGLFILVNDESYDQPGIYTQTLTSANGCDSILTIQYEVSDIYIPNVFSPDILGNDYFKPFISCDIDFYEFRIYDRWGNLMFFTEDQEAYWDGRFEDSENCEQGVYAYVVRFGNDAENSNVRAGDVTLIR